MKDIDIEKEWAEIMNSPELEKKMKEALAQVILFRYEDSQQVFCSHLCKKHSKAIGIKSKKA